MGVLSGIIDNINPENIAYWLESYAEKLETEDLHSDSDKFI